MRRPRHDLTWRGIRRRWASSETDANAINGSAGTTYYKSPSAPLLNDVFESLPNSVINIDQRTPSSVTGSDKQRSDVFVEVDLPPSGKQLRSRPEADLPRREHSFEMELLNSELRMIRSHLAILSHHTRRDEQLDDESQDWRFMGMVIDRLCLILFTSGMALFTGLTLLSTPDFYRLQ